MPRGGKRPGAGRPHKKDARKQSKPKHRKVSDKPRKLNQRQAGYIKGLAEGKSKLDAALAAGYAPSVARNAHQVIESPGVRNEFQRIITAWVDPELVGKRISEGLKAEETKFFQHEGEVTDPRQVIAWGERRRLLRAGCNLRGSAKSFWKTSDGFLNRPSVRIEGCK